LEYSREVATSKADLTAFKILIHSTLSIEEAEMMMIDINTYYLGTPLPRYEYMRMPFKRFPRDVIDKYNLEAISVNGWLYIEIIKGMYSLKLAGLLDNQQLQMLLALYGYFSA
jgi:hypothetical protein